MQIHEIMSTGVESVPPTTSIGEARARMERSHIHHLVVMEKGEVVGVVSERDLGGRNPSGISGERPVREVMTGDVVTATPTTTVRKAANLMRGYSIGCLPILDRGLVGIVTVTDLLELIGGGAPRDERPGRRLVRLSQRRA